MSKVSNLPELTQAPDDNDELYILDNSEASGSRGKKVKFENIAAGAIAGHTDGGPSKHAAAEIDYERADGSKTDIDASSDDVENALSDLDDEKLSRSGSQAMTGTLNMGGQQITNVGNVDGVDVSNHGSRHAPGGLDAIPTASPTTVLTGDSPNAEGTANTLARSDHTHNIANATESVAGLMSEGDKTKLNTVETNASADQVASEVPYDNNASGLSANDVQDAIDEIEERVEDNETDITTLQTTKQNVSEKGVANGYAGLDSSGKVPVAQLPATVLGAVQFQGTWDASSNTPNLLTASPEDGDYYLVSVAGSTNLDGITDWKASDWAVYHSSTGWQKIDNTDQVSSVFGRQGAVVAQTGDYDDVQVDYTRADGNKVSIQAISDDVGSAINDLDDNKLARSGSQAMTGNLNMGSNQITNAGNINGVSITAHASRHLPGGADALTTATAVELTDSTNAEGAAASFARSNHTHAHGNRGGGTLHAAVTTSTNGFMTAADKTKLNRMDVGHLSYSNNALQSIAANGTANINFQTDRDSFPNGLLTKVNNTDFRADFNGYVQISFKVVYYTNNNDKIIRFRIVKNGTGLDYAGVRGQGRGAATELRTLSATIMFAVATNDVFRLEGTDLDNSGINIPIDGATFSIRTCIIS